MNKAAEAWGSPNDRILAPLGADELACAQDDAAHQGKESLPGAANEVSVALQLTENLETDDPPPAEDSTSRDQGVLVHHQAPCHFAFGNCQVDLRLCACEMLAAAMPARG